MVAARSGGKLHTLAGAHHFRFDNSLPPALTVESGDTVVFECLEAYGGALGPDSTVDDLKRLPFDAVHCLTGPVAVAGAEPGDAVEVEVLEITASPWAWTGVFPGIGVLAEEFGPDSWALHIWHVGDDGRAELRPGAGVRVPVEPFCGVMGVALAEPGEHLTMPPRRVGGNIDTRHLIAGSRLLLPVEVPGALFSVGDGHLAQGDGEVCGTALETNVTVGLRFRLHKGRAPRAPQFETSRPTTSRVDGMGYLSTTAPVQDLREGVVATVHDMVELLMERYGLSRIEAYIVCSAAGDLRISVPKLGPTHQAFVTFNVPWAIFVTGPGVKTGALGTARRATPGPRLLHEPLPAGGQG
jgi:acetamidase/formamidase